MFNIFSFFNCDPCSLRVPPEMAPTAADYVRRPRPDSSPDQAIALVEKNESISQGDSAASLDSHVSIESSLDTVAVYSTISELPPAAPELTGRRRPRPNLLIPSGNNGIVLFASASPAENQPPPKNDNIMYIDCSEESDNPDVCSDSSS